MTIFGYEIMYPNRLWYLLVLIPIIAYYVWKNWDKWATFKVATVKHLKKLKTARVYLRHLPFVLEIIALALLIFAFSRPRLLFTNQYKFSEGIDIVLAIDISPSMLATDFKPNRLEVAKQVAIDFIKGRPNDRFGVVAFGGESFTVVPITLDHEAVIKQLSKLRSGIVEDGTAIGLGLANAVARLKNSKAKSKVIILLTDGVNNRGNIDPITAAKIAATYGIKVYTIGIGRSKVAKIPFETESGDIQYQKANVGVDEATLKQIAKLTGGMYFHASNKKALVEIYKQIDKLEKTKFKEKVEFVYKEEYWNFVFIAFVLVAISFLLKMFVVRIFP